MVNTAQFCQKSMSAVEVEFGPEMIDGRHWRDDNIPALMQIIRNLEANLKVSLFSI